MLLALIAANSETPTSRHIHTIVNLSFAKILPRMPRY